VTTDKLTLEDGTAVHFRELRPEDLDNLMMFYGALPKEDRRFLRIDVTNRDVVRKRMELMLEGQVIRIVAVKDSDKSIIADGALDLSPEDWRKNQAEMRVIVARSYQRMGLGMFMMRELTQIAHEHKVELLVCKMMKEQRSARKICQKLGFRKRQVITNYVVDMFGDHHSLLIMTRKVNDALGDLKNLYSNTDWRRSR
jgi:RimJ/RimL family protein N-acetyltransferase